MKMIAAVWWHQCTRQEERFPAFHAPFEALGALQTNKGVPARQHHRRPVAQIELVEAYHTVERNDGRRPRSDFRPGFHLLSRSLNRQKIHAKLLNSLVGSGSGVLAFQLPLP